MRESGSAALGSISHTLQVSGIPRHLIAARTRIIANRGWAVVEANASWASGIYGCEAAKVLEVLAGAVKRKQDLSDEDKPWIVVREAPAA
jgi:hypothetical protein